ncbi:enoyl-ACP reductase [Mycobacterium sp. CBMA271]|uniref:saccharopine dehydrogenase family protein n=1 Tax=unclassified Mycobacteroides TaxID=2618759 RepID=UPI0012DFA077|nr:MULTISPECIES: saccharopine dehydrogenase NADP-binding domain-containing protein [unclassified Mycobacteroides]MUM17868.1 enoyl-ACP reductase [Mycobacteroides sp. CBMA 326]MUM20438.1 enoyl-ACP reductase [Mycobacteroides sp. CBMA 271]
MSESLRVGGSSTSREHDIVLYGATGYVGKLTAQYLAGRVQATGARIALAGRSTEKLAAVRDACGPAAREWPLVEADTTRPSTLEAMAISTQVVVTTVGPYTKYGLPLVAACAKAGTDYADLTGELNFTRESIDVYGKQAADTGARIVHSCGFDSIPSDLGVYALYEQARADGAGGLLDTTLAMRRFRGGVSGGTAASGLEMMKAAAGDPEVRRNMQDPYSLSPDRPAEPEVGRQREFEIVRGDSVAPELDGYWLGAFLMGPYNTRIVRRSNALLDWAYGTQMRYREVMSLGHSVVAPAAAAVVTGALAAGFGLGTRVPFPKVIVERALPKAGSGPSERARDAGFYRTETYTATAEGIRYRAIVEQEGDPGYKATAVLLGESGLTLALDRAELPDRRGVLTPATAMGGPLLRRLRATPGVTIEVERL